MSQVLRAPPGPGPDARAGLRLPRVSTLACDAAEYAALAVIAVALVGELAVLFVNVVLRETGHSSLVWGDEIARLSLSTMAFVGGAVAYRRGQHVALELLQRLTGRLRGSIEALAEMAVLVIAVVLCLTSIRLVGDNQAAKTPVLGISQMWLSMPLVVGPGLIALFSVERLTRRSWRDLAGGLAGTAVLAVIVVLLVTSMRGQILGTGPALLTAGTAIVLTLLGVPIAFALAGGALAYLWVSEAASVTSVVASMQDSTGSFLLLAIPFFVLAGLLLTRIALSVDLITVVLFVLGRFRGGALQSVIAAMYVFSGASGSKAADIAAVSSGMTETLSRRGYQRGEIGAVLASSAAMGESIPPSIALLVLGSISTVPVAGLFAAGLLPAALLAACLGLVVYVRARRHPRLDVRERVSGAEVRRSLPGALLGVVVPAILVAGIVFGVATPTEVSSFAVVYVLVIGSLSRGRRRLTVRGAVASVTEAATFAGFVLFLAAAGQAFASALTLLNVPQDVAQTLSGEGRYSFIALSIIAVAILGAVLEGLPALFVMVPILVPAATALNVNPLHYGIVLVMAMGIGFFSPYLGLGSYITAGLVGERVEEVSRRLLAYSLVLLAGVLAIGFLPDISLVVPRLLNLD